MSNCPICNSQLNSTKQSDSNDSVYFDCTLCGEFYLSGSLVATLPKVLESHIDANVKLSHAIKIMQDSNPKIQLNTTIVDRILEKPLPNLLEQIDLLIRWASKNIPGPGESIFIGPKTHRSVVGAKSVEGFKFLLDHLIESGLLILENSTSSMGNYGAMYATLSVQGWKYAEQLEDGKISHKKAFIAMKFGVKELDDILENTFKPAAKRAGFDLSKLDDNPIAGLIDNNLRVNILNSEFIISDLTHDNSGAYWEAGYAEGLGKPVIYTCRKDVFDKHKTHFDTNHQYTVVWDANNLEDAGKKLTATIRATFPELAKQYDEE